MEPLTKFALYSRLFIIILQYLSNIIVPDHDADVFISPKSNDNFSNADKLIHHFFDGFVRWDAQYFMHIAKYGYTYENTLAFFPLYPLTVRLIAFVLYFVFPVIRFDSIILLTFVGLNVIIFVLCAKVLFNLTRKLFNGAVAYQSALLFCVNPASIFFSAPYTECLFCYLTLLTIWNCLILYQKYSSTNQEKSCSDIMYLIPVSLSLVVRSNGILNIGFIIYTYFCIRIKQWPKTNCVKQIIFILSTFSATCILTSVCLIPFFIYQAYCYYLFCRNYDIELPLNIVDYAEKNGFVLPGQFYKYNQSWCSDKIPLAYSYVQKQYWNVGFLNYYELKQLPNFLLAAPVLVILIKLSCQHIKCNVSKNIMDVFSFDKLFPKKNQTVLFNPILNVFVIHILFLSLFCLLFVHVQVSTRMLCSASPIFYWFCSSFLKNSRRLTIYNLFHNTLSLNECVIGIYFLTYLIIGTIMFCNFLPWT